jgi:predicted anti-sigma-YlaC factor YlaD
MSRVLVLAFALGALMLTLGGSSARQAALNQLSDSIAQGGNAFSRDDDRELIGAAAPFSLKLIEGLLAENPGHQGLLLAAARGFSQYAYVFVQQEAEEIEERDVARAAELEERARRLYRRARDYGLRGLAHGREQFAASLYADPRRVLARTDAGDVPLLYWTAASWAALIALRKGDPESLAELPVVEAMLLRALELDESFDRGALHTLMVAYEAGRPGGGKEAFERARGHFARAVELSAGTHAAPMVALAEAVSVPEQQRAEFEALLGQALRIDPAEAGDDKLAVVVAQRRAQWLLSRRGRLFSE